VKFRKKAKECNSKNNCTPEILDDAVCPPDTNEKIYRALDVAEKIAIKLAKLNGYLKKAKKKGKKKDKKLGKVKKKTGLVVLKKTKKIKKEKALKRYKPPKKK
jgi:hypothetical protein